MITSTFTWCEYYHTTINGRDIKCKYWICIKRFNLKTIGAMSLIKFTKSYQHIKLTLIHKNLWAKCKQCDQNEVMGIFSYNFGLFHSFQFHTPSAVLSLLGSPWPNFIVGPQNKNNCLTAKYFGKFKISALEL